MTRIVSFVVLVAILLVIAAVFLQVMANFLLPMFLAVLLVIMFGPLHRWFVSQCSERRRVAAGLTTASIILILLVPFLSILIPAVHEGKAIYDSMLAGISPTEAPGADVDPPTVQPARGDSPEDNDATSGGRFLRLTGKVLPLMLLAMLLAAGFRPLRAWLGARFATRPQLATRLAIGCVALVFAVPLLAVVISELAEPEPAQQTTTATGQERSTVSSVLVLQEVAAEKLADLGKRFNLTLTMEEIQATFGEKLQQWLAPIATNLARFTGNLLIGLGVMIISLYYFLADGPYMIRTIMRLSPLDARYEEQLLEQFENITRAVVVATLLSAFIQGLLAGAGFYFAGLGPVFLLMLLTMLLAMVPFVGCTAVWVPACLWLFYQGRTTAAVLLAVYCVVCVSMADNLIKPLVLHGRSNIHPLLALLSVLGGVQALGPIGIFVGPMVVVFLHALLNMLHTELDAMDEATRKRSLPNDLQA